jgi:hypothetical protein
MVLVLRYVCLLALGGASILAFISATAATGQLLLAENGRAIENPEAMGFWILALMAGVSLFSVFRFMFSRAPVAVWTWIKDNKDRLATLVLIVMIGGLFVVA